MIDRFERFVLSISEIYRCWHKIAATEMENYGLRGPHVVYLTTLSNHPEGLTASQLCSMCCRDKADVSRVTAAMEKQGLLQRETGEKNVYRARLMLTEEGRKAADHVRSRASVAVELAGNGLTTEQRTTFYNALELIMTNLHQISEDGLPSDAVG